MSKPYYTLLVKATGDFPEEKWSIAFGDYERDVVKDEADDSYGEGYMTKIISTHESQKAIDAAVAKLNEE